MVRPRLSLGLSLLLLAQPCLSAEISATAAVALSPAASAKVSATAQTLAELPGRPAPIPRVPNRAVDDFFAITLISLPFTAFWALVGALIVGGVAQDHFPPDFDKPLLAGAASVAAGASVAIGLVSVQWSSRPSDPGRARAALTPTAAVTPSPVTRP